MNVAAHLIVGGREEPFLPALLDSLEGVADLLLVNDNASEPDGPNARVLAGSAFAQRGALIVDRAPFTSFSAARNRVLDLHRTHAPKAWAAFVDADDVHRPVARCIARNLDRLDAGIARVDGYTRHYLQSFRWVIAVDRRLAFFRVTPDVRWDGDVHERLTGLSGRALVLPYVYDHYGWVLPMERQAAKGRQYASLGQAGTTHSPESVAQADPATFFSDQWPDAMPYSGPQPPAVAAVRAMLEARDGATYAAAEGIIAQRHGWQRRLFNTFRRLNYAYRWRARALDPLARRTMRCFNSGSQRG
jgi:hypothetical protein